MWRLWENQPCTDKLALSNKNKDEMEEKQWVYSPDEQRMTLNCHECIEGLLGNVTVGCTGY